MLAVGIDPSSGARSSVGFSVIDMETMQILVAKEFKIPASPDLKVRLKHIAAHMVKEFKILEVQDQEYIICIEQTVMRGKGGESLNRAIGAIMVTMPLARKLYHVSNMRMKLFISGSGKGDKKDIAEGLKKYFPNSDLLFQLTTSSRWDTIDSIGIAITGYKENVEKLKIVSNTKSKSAIKKSMVKP